MHRRAKLRQGLVVVLCLATSVAAASCGAKQRSQAKKPSAVAAAALPVIEPAPNVILPSEARAAAPASPQRTLLTWVEAVQFGDLQRVRQLTAPTTLARVGVNALNREVLATGATFARPEIVDSRIDGDLATLNLLLVSYSARTREPVLSLPATVRLVNEPDGWRMLDVGLLLPGGTP